MHIQSKRIALFIVFLTAGCNHHQIDETVKIPESIRQLENLTVHSLNTQTPDTMELIRETVFESNEGVFIDGYIGTVAVDNKDRVFIGASKMGHAAIYVFNPDGNFVGEIGRHGRGPGEFENIQSMGIAKDVLYVFCSSLQKMIRFSLEDFSHINDVVISRQGEKDADDITRRLRVDRLLVPGNDNPVVRLQTLAIYREADERAVYYRKLSDNGSILPENLLEKKRFKLYFHVNEGMDVPFPMPFTRSSLVSVTNDGRFYTIWTEEFLINVYDSTGSYERAFYYPVENAPLSMRDFNLSRDRQRALDQYEMPETWPAVHTMEMDNEGRLWVATITGSDAYFQWYVLGQDGEALARFQLPGRRASRPVMSNPLIRIHNGYFYTHERSISEGIDRIVKHKICFKKR